MNGFQSKSIPPITIQEMNFEKLSKTFTFLNKMIERIQCSKKFLNYCSMCVIKWANEIKIFS